MRAKDRHEKTMNVIAARLRVSLLPALVHLGLSAGVALLSMGLIFLLWYPAPLDEAQGVSRLVLILIGVDVVLGPLMTCIVYNPAKPRLWLDLAIIAVLQISALGYGLSTIHQGRPIYLVFNIDRFDVVTMKSVVPDSLTRVPGGLDCHRTATAETPSRGKPQ